MANFGVGQQTQRSGSGDSFADYIQQGTIEQDVLNKDENTGDNVDNNINFVFKNPYLRLTDSLSMNASYYLHVKIYRLSSIQDYNIRLVKKDDSTKRQQLRTIKINSAVNDGTAEVDNDFADVEFIFTPLDSDFDSILFELQRNEDDLDIRDQEGKITGRVPKIAFIELSTIRDKIPSLEIGNDVTQLPKIGVRSHPSLMLCINGEEIHVSRSGVFELRDGLVPIKFFSVVNGATPVGNQLNTWMVNVKAGSEVTKCFLNNANYPKDRIIDAFTLDYLYKLS